MSIKPIILTTLVLTGLFILFSMSPDQPKSVHSEFLEFRQQYRKEIVSPTELEYRFKVFQDNMDFIKKHNNKNSTYSLGVNHFADLTWEEFQNSYLSTPIDNEVSASLNTKVETVKEIDWREKGAVTPVKNQGMCGSCWAFSTTGSLEGALAINKGSLPSLSEQELVDCSRSYGNNGCNGGLMQFGFAYIQDHSVGTEKDYPYQGRDQSCKRKDEGERYAVTDYVTLDPVDVTGLSAALEKGPVSVALEVRRDFQMYKRGVYTASKSCGSRLNHGVLLVGQKDNYYIVKNSWSSGWGEKGFIRMAIDTGRGTCGIANQADGYPQL